ncbi:hypothetical protein C5O19_12315 [Siphonobacter curvatus]|uniref:Iron dicitrate transport regulator FecR n=2 Tax=Siphonobacter curvatus TaxID=2094562 RepID=A0A2S7IRL7_9BACT|nr:hypothetical protein C5O19_12315 [Siphonobacter curvatus]
MVVYEVLNLLPYMDKDDLYRQFGMEEPDEEPSSRELEQEILQRIHGTLGFEAPKVRRFRWAYGLAASIVLLISSVCVYYWMARDTQAISIQIPAGKVREITLPDGSVVWLNAATALHYAPDFNQNREVFLEDGEAFFRVVHDEKRPFVVHAGNVQTRVLGTTFRVKAYQALETMQVSVVTGKVAVSEGTKSLAVLEKNQEITYLKTEHKAIERTIDAAETVEWQTGNVVLKAVSFADIALAIENAYGVRVSFNRATFRNCVSSLAFQPQSQKLSEVLDLVKDIQGIQYEIKGKEVLISGTECQ